jgi:hypothetical protein
MNALIASLPPVDRQDLLWAIPWSPLASAAALFELERRRRAARSEADHAPRVGMIAAAFTLAACLWAAAAVLGEGDGRALFAPGWSFARIDALDATIALLCDATSIAPVIVIALASLVAQIVTRGGGGTRASVAVATAGALLAVLADGLPTLLIGEAIAALAILALLASSPARGSGAAILGRLGAVAASVGVVAIFWSLGGSWGIPLGLEPNYTRRNPVPALAPGTELESDDPLGPIAVPVVASAPARGARPDPSARGSLTLISFPSAKIFLRGALEPAAVAPVVRHEVPAGRIDVEIETRPGAPRIHFRALEIPEAGEVTITKVGPTLSFRELRDQLLLADAGGRRFVRDLLDPAGPAHRRFGPRPIVWWSAVLAALAFAAFVSAGAIVAKADDAGIRACAALPPAIGTLIFARAASSVALASVGPAIAAVVAAVALSVAFFARGQGIVAVAGFAAVASAAVVPELGAVPGSLTAIAIVAWAASTSEVAGEGSGERGQGATIAEVALLGAVPIIGTALVRDLAVGRLFGDSGWLGKVAGAALVAAAAIAAISTRPRREAGAGPRGLVLAVALLSAAVGPLTVAFALGRSSPIAKSLGLEPDPMRATGVIGAVLSALVVLGAFLVGRRIASTGEPRAVGAAFLPAAARGVRSVLRWIARLDERIFVEPLPRQGAAEGEER